MTVSAAAGNTTILEMMGMITVCGDTGTTTGDVRDRTSSGLTHQTPRQKATLKNRAGERTLRKR